MVFQIWDYYSNGCTTIFSVSQEYVIFLKYVIYNALFVKYIFMIYIYVCMI